MASTAGALDGYDCFVKNTFLTSASDVPKPRLFRTMSSPEILSSWSMYEDVPPKFDLSDDDTVSTGSVGHSNSSGSMEEIKTERESQESIMTLEGEAGTDASQWCTRTADSLPDPDLFEFDDDACDTAEGRSQFLSNDKVATGNENDTKIVAGAAADSSTTLRSDAQEYWPDPWVAVPVLVYPTLAPPAADLDDFLDKTTVMMRNIPNKYTRALLLDELCRTGFGDAYDFVYLPIEEKTKMNRGYAFINFSNPDNARAFHWTYEGSFLPFGNPAKLISVVPAALQGWEANHEHYANARCSKGSPATRPLFLQKNRASKTQNYCRPANQGSRGYMQGASVTNSRAFDKFCPFCGKGVQMTYRFCIGCGQSVDAPKVEVAEGRR